MKNFYSFYGAGAKGVSSISSRGHGAKAGLAFLTSIAIMANFQLEGGAPCRSCVNCFMESKVTKGEFGGEPMSEYCDQSTPPKYYLNETVVNSGNNTDASGNTTDYSYTITTTYDLSASFQNPGDSDCVWRTPSTVTYDGHIEYSDSGNSDSSTMYSDLEAWIPTEKTPDWGTFEPWNCHGKYFWLCPTPEPATNTCSKTSSDIVYTLSSGSASGQVRTYKALSDPVNDSMLLAGLIAHLPSYPSDWSSGSGEAFFKKNTDLCVTGGKMQYRFKIPHSESDLTYLVTWKEQTIHTNGTVTKKAKQEEIDGTGDPINPALGGAYEIDVPKIDGDEATVVDVCVTARSHSTPPPGSGGSGSGASGGGAGSGGGRRGRAGGGGSGGGDSSDLDSSGGGCPSCSGGGDDGDGGGDDDDSGASMTVSMGGAGGNFSAGHLYYNQYSPSADAYNPASLEFSGHRGDVEVITNGTVLRQILAPQALADIVSNANSFSINFYYPTQVLSKVSGVYQLTGSPYASWTITNSNPSSTNQIRIIEARDGVVSRQWDYTATSDSGDWTVQPLNTSAQLTTTTTSWVSGSDNFRSRETLWLASGGTSVKRVKTTFQQFDWDGMTVEMPIEVDEGADGSARKTLYTYADSPSGFGGTFVPYQSIVNWDGSWEYFASYDGAGHVTDKYSSFGNYVLPSGGATPDGTQCRETVTSYSSVDTLVDDGTINPDVPRSVTEKLFNQPVSQRYTVIPSTDLRIDIQYTSSSPSGGLYDSANLFTTNRYYTNGANQGRLKSVVAPDKTFATYNYGVASDGTFTNITVTGQPDSAYSHVVDGVSNRVVVNAFGNLVSKLSVDVASQATIDQAIYSNFDSLGRPQTVTYLDGTTEQVQYACCGLDNTTDRDGVLTQYWRDYLKRITANTRLDITTTNVLDAAGRKVQTIRIGSDSSPIILSQSQYDLAGRLTLQTNALNGVTSYFETNDSSGALIQAQVNPDGGTRTNFYFLDGSLKKTVGTAVHPVRYEYGLLADNSPYSAEIKLDSSGSDTLEAVTNVLDFAGRTVETIYSNGKANHSAYNNNGQLWKQIDPDSVTKFYVYNGKGEQSFTVTPMNATDQAISDYSTLVSSLSSLEGGGSRITTTTNDVVSSHSTWVRRSRTFVWDTLNANSSKLTSMSENSADGLDFWTTAYRDISTPVVNHQQITFGAVRTVVATLPDSSYTTSVYTNGRLFSVTKYDSTPAQIGQTLYYYDAHGRVYQMVDARNGATTYSYNNADLVSGVTTPNPGNGSAAETTVKFYNPMLQVTNTTQPDGTSVTNEYFQTGELKRTYGTRTYPAAYAYDYAGRMKTMTNWSAFPTTGARVTTWNYDVHRGFLANKVYDITNGPIYAYTDGGRLATRTWLRGTVTTYRYDNAGGLTNVAYNDGMTSSVTNTYDRLGRVIQIGASNQVCQYQYDLAGELLVETNTAGILVGLAVTNGYDVYMRRTDLATISSGVLSHTTYGYDNASRLSTVSDGTNNATYSYVANSLLVNQITFKSNSVTAMTTTKQYDLLNRLTQISNAPSASAAIAFNYNYNNANQRTKDTLVDGSYWVYQYDSLGQVTSGKKYWRDGTPVAGQQFEYGFDDIGNRTSAKTGGNETGANLRPANYTNNSLNQITSRDVPGFVDVAGIALATNSVTVNLQPAYRKGEYFRDELTVVNTNVAVWTSITVASPGQTSVVGNKYSPKTAEAFYYDADGNLTNDGRWLYTWDGENRLVKMVVNTNVGPQYQLAFAYDSRGRRIQKYISTNNVGLYTNKFLYDGWNLVGELNSGSGVIRSYMWGIDLSGSVHGAGGVGGLLGIAVESTNNFVGFDGDGNLSILVINNGTNGAIYEYSPFGEVLRATGLMVKANPFSYSTKYQDEESGLFYYGYRYYNSSKGVWLSRDPLNEKGSKLLTGRKSKFVLDEEKNQYAFLDNDPLNDYDFQGLNSGVLGWLEGLGGAGAATLSVPLDLVALGAIAIVGLADAFECQHNLRCRDCTPKVGTLMYEIAPANSRQRGKHVGIDHVKYWRMNQAPLRDPLIITSCSCYWNYDHTDENTLIPAPGAIPGGPPNPAGGPALGGGIEEY